MSKIGIKGVKMARKTGVLGQSLVVGAVMFGSVVGAGFASGKEVWFYFAQFGWVCFPLIILAGLLLFALGYQFLEFGKRNGIESVQQMNSKLFGKWGNVGEIIFIISNIILLSAMFAGANSLFDIVLDTNFYRYASVLTAVISIFVSWLGFSKMVKVNILVVPFLVAVITVSFIYCLTNSNGFVVPLVDGTDRLLSAIFFCVLYVCSNLYFAGFIFARLGREHSSKANLVGSLIGAGFMVLCLLGMVVSIYLNPYSSMSDMPLVYIAKSVSNTFGTGTLLVVWLGILTTSVSLIYTISIWLQKYVKSYKIATVFVSIVCLLISGLGFGLIVSYCYPVMGFFGIVFMLRMIFYEKKLRKKARSL